MARRTRTTSALVAAGLVALAAVPSLRTLPASGATAQAAEPHASGALASMPATASASKVASRGPAVQVSPTSPPPVDPRCSPPAGLPASARQVVSVAARGTYAMVDLLVVRDGVWTCERMAMTGRVGRNGVRPLPQRVSGDGTTPTGTFPLATMTAPDGETFQFFGNGVDPGVPGSWRQVRAGDCWDATGGDLAYNTLTTRAEPACTGGDEYLPSIVEAYSRAALIGANMGADRSGDQPGEIPRAAAIFLHRFSYDLAGRSRPTSGCVSLSGADLDAVLRTLVPGEAWFVIG